MVNVLASGARDSRFESECPDMKPKLLIFDLFGTLIFPAFKIKREKFFDFYRKIGIQLKTEEDIKSFSSLFSHLMGSAKNWTILSQELLEKTVGNKNPGTVKLLADFFKENLIYQLYDDVKEIISLSCRKAILTSGSRFLFSNLHLEKHFEVFTPQETKFLKPDKKAFLVVLEKFGGAAKTALMIGDEPERDLFPAKELGMKTILIDRDNKFEKYQGVKIDSLRKLESVWGL